MPWDRVHDEAEVLEHYISEELEERMAAALGDPSHDPHGDPIPDRGSLPWPPRTGVSLAELEPGEGGVFSRVSDSDPEMLRYLAERGIHPGVELRVARARAVRAARCSSRSTIASTCSAPPRRRDARDPGELRPAAGRGRTGAVAGARVGLPGRWR